METESVSVISVISVDEPRVVVVGGGFGGLEAARGLRRAAVRITLIDRTNHHVFQPLLYQVATAGLSPADIAAPIRGILARQRNCEVFLGEVSAIDTAAREVILAPTLPLSPSPTLRIPYDYLILATGARHAYFGHDEWEQFAPGLKSIADATAMRRKILLAFEAAELEQDAEMRQALLTFVIVGAGPTGVELAGAIAELSRIAMARDFRHIDPREARILLVEAGPRILPTFTEELARATHRELESHGVEVRTDSPVEQIDAVGVVIAGQRLACRTVLWAAGVAASPAGKWLGADVDRAGRVKVNEDLTVPGHPNVFVIGDAMTLAHHGKPLPGVAQVAMQQGAYVAGYIRRRMAGFQEYPPFRYHDKGNMATVGRSFAIVDAATMKLTGFVAWLAWLGIHIWYLIGFRNRLLVLIQWAWAYFTYQRSARLIVLDPPAAAGNDPGATSSKG